MEDNNLKRFGEYIKLLRESEGLSQEELAKKSGFAGRAAEVIDLTFGQNFGQNESTTDGL